MSGERVFRTLGITALAALCVLIVWARVTSLKTAPYPHADEAFFGVQAEHLVQGKHVASSTGSGKPVDLFYTIVEAPLHLVFPPTYTVERIPAVLFGCLAVWLTYVLGSRVLDRTTAAIAAILLGVLPVAIIFSRIGWEYCEVPLLCLLIVYFAFRAQRIGLLLAYLACIHVSPTVLFLAPVPLALLAVRLLPRPSDGEPRALSRRSILVTMALLSLMVVGIGLWKRDNPTTQWTYATYHFGPCDWGRYFRLYKQHLMGFCQGSPYSTSARHDWLFWTPYVVVLILGTDRLIRDRRWDRLALVAGTAASTAGYHLVVGPEGFHPALARYGLFLTLPTVLSFACLIEALLFAPTTSWRLIARRVQLAGLTVVAYVIFASYVGNYFSIFVLQGGESFWTLKTEASEPLHKTASLLARDIDRQHGPKTMHVIVADDWWTYKPLQYFLGRRDDIDIGRIESVPPERKGAIVIDNLRRGGYAVGFTEQTVDATVKAAFPAESLRHWHIKVGPHPCVVIYRLRRPGESDGRCFCKTPLASQPADTVTR